MKTYNLGATFFKVGQNAQENWDLIRNYMRNSEEFGNSLEFLWFHLDEFPSAHVIIEQEEPDNDEINYACELVIQHSKNSKFSKKIVYTKIKNLKLGPEIGSVIFRKFDECKYRKIN